MMTCSSRRLTNSPRAARTFRIPWAQTSAGNGNCGAIPDGHCYYLKAWPMDEPDYGNAGSPGAELTVMEAFQFLLTNWMPRDVMADLAFERPDLIKPFEFPPGGAG